METTGERNLTGADVAALVEALELRVMSTVGRALMALLGNWALRAALLIAAYGAGSEGWLKKILE